MSKTNTHEDGYLKLLFQNVNFANIGDATGLRGSTTAGSLYVALFTAVANGETGTVTEVYYWAIFKLCKNGCRSLCSWLDSFKQRSE